MWILGVATRYGKCQELPVSSCRANAQCMRIPAPGVPSYPNRGFTCTPFPPRSTCVDQPLWGRTDDPCGPRAPVQRVWGRGMGFPSRSSGLTWAVSTIRARAGRCREGGLSSTDERVRGHVTEVTQALRKSSEWYPVSSTRIVEMIQTLTDLDSTC